jgi:hypothetical protein
VPKSGSLRLLSVVLIACVAAGGVLAGTGAAEPAVESAANLASSVKKALRVGKRADKKARTALATARRAEKAAAGKRGPAGPQGERATNGTSGVAGAPGPAGAAGTTGPQGTTGLWAVIGDTGINATLVRGTASGQGHPGIGTFYVSFAPTDISSCAYIASIGSTTDQTPPALYATVEQRAGFPTDVRLRSFNAAGAPTDPGTGNGFHVAVIC